MGRIIDVSLGIGPGMLTWPSDPGVEVERAKRIEAGDAANVSQLRFGSHTGTHVDPPIHFIPGQATVDQLPLEVFYGPAVVADLREAAGEIGPDELDDIELPDGVERLLLKTKNSRLWSRKRQTFPKTYVSVGVDGARWLVEKGVKLVGVDFLSVEAFGSEDHAVHTTLLGAGVVIVEGLDLSKAAPGEYLFSCLPLKVLGGDGAPARAALIET